MSTNNKSAENKSVEEAAVEAEQTEEAKETTEEAREEIAEEEKVERKREAEEDIVQERVYTVALGRAWVSPRKDRAPKAIRILKSFIERHMKPESIVVSEEVNERIWRRGIEKPPRKIRIRAVKDRDGKVNVDLAEAD